MRLILLAVLFLATSCAPPPQTASADRRVRLINNSAKTIVAFHASNVSRDKWEEDILRDRVVAPGQSISINIDDGSGYCNFDFMTVMRGGQQVVKRNVNVCQVANYTIND